MEHFGVPTLGTSRELRAEEIVYLTEMDLGAKNMCIIHRPTDIAAEALFLG